MDTLIQNIIIRFKQLGEAGLKKIDKVKKDIVKTEQKSIKLSKDKNKLQDKTNVKTKKTEITTKKITRNIQKSGEATLTLFQRIGKAAREASSLDRMFSRMAFVTTALISYALLDLGKTIVKDLIGNTVKWEAELSKIFALVEGIDDAMRIMLSEDVLRLMVKYGQELETSVKAVYDIISARFAPAEVQLISEAAAKMAIGEFTDIGTAIDAVTTILNAYSMSASQSTEVTDLLSRAVTDAKSTLAAMAPNIGKIVAVGNAFNLSLKESIALFSLMTLKGLQTDVTITAIRQLMFTLATPTQKAKEAMKEYGVSLDLSRIQAEGFAYIIKELSGANEEFLLTLVKSKTGAMALLPLLSDSAGFMELLENQTNNAGEALRKYNERADDAALKNKKNRAELFALSIVLKEKMLPVINAVLGAITGLTIGIGILIKNFKYIAVGIMALIPIMYLWHKVMIVGFTLTETFKYAILGLKAAMLSLATVTVAVTAAITAAVLAIGFIIYAIGEISRVTKEHNSFLDEMNRKWVEATANIKELTERFKDFDKEQLENIGNMIRFRIEYLRTLDQTKDITRTILALEEQHAAIVDLYHKAETEVVKSKFELFAEAKKILKIAEDEYKLSDKSVDAIKKKLAAQETYLETTKKIREEEQKAEKTEEVDDTAKIELENLQKSLELNKEKQQKVEESLGGLRETKKSQDALNELKYKEIEILADISKLEEDKQDRADKYAATIQEQEETILATKAERDAAESKRAKDALVLVKARYAATQANADITEEQKATFEDLINAHETYKDSLGDEKAKLVVILAIKKLQLAEELKLTKIAEDKIKLEKKLEDLAVRSTTNRLDDIQLKWDREKEFIKENYSDEVKKGEMLSVRDLALLNTRLFYNKLLSAEKENLTEKEIKAQLKLNALYAKATEDRIDDIEAERSIAINNINEEYDTVDERIAARAATNTYYNNLVAAEKEKLSEQEIKEAEDAVKSILRAGKLKIQDLELLREKYKDNAKMLEYINELIEKWLQTRDKKFSWKAIFDIPALEDAAAAVKFVEQQMADVVMGIWDAMLQHQLDIIEEREKNQLEALDAEMEARRKQINSIAISEKHKAKMLEVLAEEEAKKKKEIEDKAASDMRKQKKKNAKYEAAIDLAKGLIAIWSKVATLTVWGAVGLSAILGAVYAAQIGIIEATKYVKGGLVKAVEMAKGGITGATNFVMKGLGGVLQGPSHAQGGIPIIAEGKEHIMPVKQTAWFLPILEFMRKARSPEAFAPMLDMFKGMTPMTAPIPRHAFASTGGVVINNDGYISELEEQNELLRKSNDWLESIAGDVEKSARYNRKTSKAPKRF